MSHRSMRELQGSQIPLQHVDQRHLMLNVLHIVTCSEYGKRWPRLLSDSPALPHTGRLGYGWYYG